MASSSGTKTDESTAPPPWLIKLLKIKFYDDEESSCQKHRRKYKTLYCIDCMSGPFCDACTFDLWPHHRHRLLRVRRCSFEAAIEKEAIEKVVKVAQIQPFSINSYDVVLLQERSRKGKGNLMCKVCEGSIHKACYLFCSIACQLEAENGPQIEDNGVVTPSDSTEEKIENPSRSRRKGIPVRSPLF